MKDILKISVVLPCRDEAAAIGLCLAELKTVLQNLPKIKSFEIIVSDSSVDKSAAIARAAGVKVIKHDRAGYGRAYLAALPVASGDYLVMADADYSYDFKDLPKLIAALNRGADLVIGSRLAGQIDQGAMPWIHRRFGTPLLNFLLKIFFGLKLTDSQSGFRAIKQSALERLSLIAPGMEFASEMIIKAQKAGLEITEVPIHYRRRIGQSKLKSFNDGWKHLRFMLLFSPNYLFLAPGGILFAAGLAVSTIFLFPPINIWGLTFITHPMFLAALATIVGYELIWLGLFAKVYAFQYLSESDRLIKSLLKYLDLEKALLAGLAIFTGGLALFLFVAGLWLASNFGEITNPNLSIYSLLIMVIGIQTIFNAFFISILGIKH